MTERQIRVAYKPSFKKAYKKLQKADREKVDQALRSLLGMMQAQVSGDQERVKALATQLRAKKINKFKGSKPPRMEASWSGNGRIVWTIDSGSVELTYIHLGGHEVLEKE